MLPNFTIHDIASGLLAFLIYPLIMVIPGYGIGWILNLFNFRKRLPLVRYVIAIVLSNAIVPIFVYLLSFFISVDFTIGVLFVFGVIWVVILWVSRNQNKIPNLPLIASLQKRYQILALMIGGGWIIFCLLWLVDIQLGNSLYFTSISYDYSTRVSMIDAITRTGVPPINPSYYPGHPEKLTFLYYFWYILASVIDKIGGNWVNASTALIAGVMWCGLCLMATVALYLRTRSREGGAKVWGLAIVASQLLLVSGLDFIPVIMLMIVSRLSWGYALFNGRIEGWNMPIMDWLGGMMWVPLHFSSMMACLTGLMLFLYHINGNKKQHLIAACISGIAFASALGLSVWITFAFAIFWVIWALVLFFGQKRRQMAIFLALTGVIALLLSYPFITGLIHSQTQPGASAGPTLPITLYVRPFPILAVFAEAINTPSDVANFLLLPINYFFELGFFFIVAVLWIKQNRKIVWKDHPHQLAEIILFFIIVIMLSFLRSTIIMINDFGIRAWLPGQFVLLIWAVDLVEARVGENRLSIFSVFNPAKSAILTNKILVFLLMIGVLTTALDMTIIRTWPMLIDANIAGFPNELSPDTNLGKRTYAARLAYAYIRDNTPETVVIQDNPTIILNRPGGLYGTRQMAISDRTAYGVPADQYKFRTEQIGEIFLSKNIKTWDGIDKICDQYFINIIILNDIDPLWGSLKNLEQKRAPLYQNQYYAILACGHSTLP